MADARCFPAQFGKDVIRKPFIDCNLHAKKNRRIVCGDLINILNQGYFRTLDVLV